MIGIKIKKNKANDLRKILLKHSIIDLHAKIKREDDFVIIPVISTPDNDILNGFEDYEIAIWL